MTRALKHAESGEVVNIYSAYSQISESRSQAIVSAAEIEVVRLVLNAGKAVPQHALDGPFTLHCLKGAIEVKTHGDWISLGPDDLIYLAGGILHDLRALADSTVLLTLFRAH